MKLDTTYLTRVRVPQRRSDTLHRERLVDFLHEQVECRLLLISAPAGYGKTTLLVDFAHSAGGPVCWYGLSEADKDLRVFIEYLVASVRQRYPTFGVKTLGLLERVADLAREMSSVVGLLVSEMQDSIPEYFFIVLDDYHLVDESPLVNEALDLILYYLPANCHIIVSSRTLPKISLSRLAAKRMVAGLGTSDLRFTVQEIRDFMLAAFKMLLLEPVAQELADKSEGWITGIVLSTYSLSQGMLETITRAQKSGSPVLDYLASEVFNQQPPEVQSFLSGSSILRQFDAGRCAEVLRIDNAQEMLLAVEDRNLFITRLEGSDWYQYHNLFAEYLQNKLKTEFPERYRELNLLAAVACHRRGEADNAVRHYVLAEQYDQIVSIAEEAGEGLLNAGKLQTLQRWLGTIPAATLEANPLLLAFQARVLYQTGELDRALALFSRAIADFARQGDKPNAARATVKRSSVLRLMGRLQEAVEELQRVLSISADDPEVEAEARKGIGIIRGIEGKFAEGIAELKRSFALYEGLGNTYQMAELFHAIGMAHYSKADLSAAEEYYRRSLALSEQIGDLGFAATTLNNMAMVSYRRGDYTVALETLRQALDKVHKAGYLRMEAHVLDSLGCVLQDADEFDEAVGSFENALELGRRVNELPLISQLLDEIGVTYALKGDLARADRFIREAFVEIQGQARRSPCPHHEMAAGLLAFRRGEPRQAIGHFSKACRGFKAAGAKMELARAHYYLAAAYLSRDDIGGAEEHVRAFDQSVSSLGGEGYLLADIKRLPAPVEFAVSRGIGVKWIERAWRRLGIAGESCSEGTRPASPLGKRAPDTDDAASGAIRAFALGNCRVICGDREVVDADWVTQVTKELFFFLASQPRGARREEIVDALWPELSPARAISNFHGTLYRLRRATYSDLVLHQGGRYFLNPGIELWYDAAEFEDCVNRALSSGAGSHDAAPHWEKAAAIYQGAFLAQFYGEWCEAARRRLEDRFLRALGVLARHTLAKGNLAASVAYLEKALAVDPYVEESHRQLLRLYHQSGDQASVIRHYNRLVQMLRDELGTEPEPETVSVYNSLLGRTRRLSKEPEHLSSNKGG
ncbi:MAG: tetratricopeptide repeat protein [Chloroflexi bacterium]|nr:tetratricopeptide repeat protein [Chloroflexota bacterium]